MSDPDDLVAYPAQHDVDAVLRDGSTVHLRPAVPADRDALALFLNGLSEGSKVFRFFHAVKEPGSMAARFLDMDYRERYSLIALHGDPEAIVGHGYYALGGEGRAEVAFAVADALQGQGLGTLLLGQLAQAATAAGIAASDVTVDALFAQSGVIRADTLGEVFDVAGLLATQPAPAGRRVGILTNAGGLGIMCADACGSSGLVVPQLSDATRRALADFLPAAASLSNPVDMIASAAPADYERAIGVLAGSGDIDALIVIFIPPLRAEPAAVVAAVRRAVLRLERRLPVLAVLMGGEVGEAAASGDAPVIPTYAFPENAARALARVAGWAEWRSRPEEEPWRLPTARSDEARAIVATALKAGDGWLAPDAMAALLGCYGVPLANWRFVATPEETASAAAELGGRVALKAVGPKLVHKSELGAVQLSLAPRSVEVAARRLADRLAAAGVQVSGFLVQEMVPEGVEMIVGVVQDPVFGPVIACGAGGTAVELMKDVAVRLTPLTEAEAGRMLSGLATFPLLNGYRGRPRVDLPALEALLVRVSGLAEDVPELVEVDLDPVMVTPSGAVVTDTRIRVELREPQPPEGARRRANGRDPARES